MGFQCDEGIKCSIKANSDSRLLLKSIKLIDEVSSGISQIPPTPFRKPRFTISPVLDTFTPN